MDLQFFELTIFTNAIVNNQKHKIECKKFGPFDSIRKANICCNKKIDLIKNNLKNLKNTFNELEFDIDFECDFIIEDITKKELS